MPRGPRERYATRADWEPFHRLHHSNAEWKLSCIFQDTFIIHQREVGFLRRSACFFLPNETSSQRKSAEFPHCKRGQQQRLPSKTRVSLWTHSSCVLERQKTLLAPRKSELAPTKQQHPHERTREVHLCNCCSFFCGFTLELRDGERQSRPRGPDATELHSEPRREDGIRGLQEACGGVAPH